MTHTFLWPATPFTIPPFCVSLLDTTTAPSSPMALSSRTPTTALSIRGPQTGTTNYWVPLVPNPSSIEITAFYARLDISEHDATTFQLSDQEHVTDRLLQHLLKNVHWRTSLFKPSDPPGSSMKVRLDQTFEAHHQFTPKRTATPNATFRFVVYQAGQYIDAFDAHCREMVNLLRYQSWGLVPTPPGLRFGPRDKSRYDAVRVSCAMIFIDRLLDTAAFHLDSKANLANVPRAYQAYASSITHITAPAHAIYDPSTMVHRNSAAQACRDTVSFNRHLDNMMGKSKPGEVVLTEYSRPANKMLRSMAAAETKTKVDVTEVNSYRACFSMLTLYSQTPVRQFHSYALLMTEIFITGQPRCRCVTKPHQVRRLQGP